VLETVLSHFKCPLPLAKKKMRGIMLETGSLAIFLGQHACDVIFKPESLIV